MSQVKHEDTNSKLSTEILPRPSYHIMTRVSRLRYNSDDNDTCLGCACLGGGGGGGGRVQAYRYNTFIKNAVVTFISSDLTEQGGTACMVACDFGSNRHVNDATLVQSDN